MKALEILHLLLLKESWIVLVQKMDKDKIWDLLVLYLREEKDTLLGQNNFRLKNEMRSQLVTKDFLVWQ